MNGRFVWPTICVTAAFSLGTAWKSSIYNGTMPAATSQSVVERITNACIKYPLRLLWLWPSMYLWLIWKYLDFVSSSWSHLHEKKKNLILSRVGWCFFFRPCPAAARDILFSWWIWLTLGMGAWRNLSHHPIKFLRSCASHHLWNTVFMLCL
jgi:hypothetical protein